MAQGWQITCGKCGEVASVNHWLRSRAVETGECHFQCPNCKVKLRRVAHGTKQIEIDTGVSVFVPGRIKIEEIA